MQTLNQILTELDGSAGLHPVFAWIGSEIVSEGRNRDGAFYVLAIRVSDDLFEDAVNFFVAKQSQHIGLSPAKPNPVIVF